MLEIITRSIAVKTIRENLDALIRFAFFRLGDMSKAEDAVQDAVLKLLDNPPSLFKSGNLKSYLYKMVYHKCQDSLRYDSRNQIISIDTIDDPADREDESLNEEEAMRINGILGNLPEKESEVIRMSVIDELSFAEIGRILNIPASTVKYRYKCGMMKMRDRYNSKN